MRPHIVLGLAVVAACAASSSRGADDAKEELKKLRGEWAMTGAEFWGADAFDPSRRPGLLIDADKIVLRHGGEDITYGYTLKPSASPKEIDLSGPDGLTRGVYKAEGDELWLCVGDAKGRRPPGFETKGTFDRRLYKFKRVKPPDDATVKEMKKLAGTWAVQSLEDNGILYSDKYAKRWKYVISEGKIVIQMQADSGKTESTRQYELDVTSKPKTIKMVNWENDTPGAKFHGIYALDGDELTVCVGPADMAQPTAFESKPKSRVSLMKLKREKP